MACERSCRQTNNPLFGKTSCRYYDVSKSHSVEKLMLDSLSLSRSIFVPSPSRLLESFIRISYRWSDMSVNLDTFTIKRIMHIRCGTTHRWSFISTWTCEPVWLERRVQNSEFASILLLHSHHYKVRRAEENSMRVSPCSEPLWESMDIRYTIVIYICGFTVTIYHNITCHVGCSSYQWLSWGASSKWLTSIEHNLESP